jgi:hypothetical protein
MTIRTIPVRELHGSDCQSCAAVERWLLNRKRPATKRAGEFPDLAGAAFGAHTASRDVEPRRPSEAPDVPPTSAPPSRSVSPVGSG